MKCVKCNGELKPVTLGVIEVDQCEDCSGIWFDLGELQKILDHENIDRLKNKIHNNAGHDQQKGKCPKCGGMGNMVQVTRMDDPNIHIDTCLVCYGQWLDGGELEKLKGEGIIDKLKKIFRI